MTSFGHGATMNFYSICSGVPEAVVIGKLGCWDPDEKMVVNPSQDGTNAGGTHDVCPRTANIAINTARGSKTEACGYVNGKFRFR